ncbi:hypothetical protein BX600DRAFT_401577 [Xylariales sp. PMI_506]|nr:hypothetical protein BX600DRAFT_401577 [Xylariales sp. PMI_506]
MSEERAGPPASSSIASPAQPQHITFEDDEKLGQGCGPGPGPRGRDAELAVPAGRSRSVSRASSRISRQVAVRPEASARAALEVPIEYHTLSIQVSESRHASAVDRRNGGDGGGGDPEAGAESESASSIERKANFNYFAGLNYHELSPEQVLQQLDVNGQEGLSKSTAEARLERDGPNTLPQPTPNYVRKLLVYTFGGFCSVLWVGVVVFFICWKPLSDPPSLNSLATAILILIVIFLQAGFTAFQDWSTSRTMRSILDCIPSRAHVLRDGQEQFVRTETLVVGDLVHLKPGDKVPADLRLLYHSGDMRFDRAVLTGESQEIDGAVEVTDPNFLESQNIALMGTIVANGCGVGVVVLTGARSVMGRIVQAMSDVKAKHSLIQKEVWRFISIIIILTIFLALIIVIAWVAWLRRDHPEYMSLVTMLVITMGCVVAFIPEGLPIAISLTLMLIARRMKKVNVLPKTLGVVETLGCVTVVCSDKTGTLTENVMSVRSVALLDQRTTPDEVRCADSKAMQMIIRASALCSEAVFDPTHFYLPTNERAVLGNATDAAVLRLCAQGDLVDVLRKASPKIYQIPFNSRSKWMLTVHYVRSPPGNKSPGRFHVFVKGAPDVLLPACTSYWSSKTDKVEPLDDEMRAAYRAFHDEMSRSTERVIVLCERAWWPSHQYGTNAFSEEVRQGAVQDLTVVGIIGIIDPARRDAHDTVAAVRRSGARFFMVTGDYGLTAAAVARQVGIFTREAAPHSIDNILRADASQPPPTRRRGHRRVYTRPPGVTRSLLLEGPQILNLSADEWDLVCDYEEIVFARTSPEQKLRIVTELQRRRNIVAVTGDGVNDAPAMYKADIGVAVATGSDVAIEAADLVLLQKFDSIIEGIKLGRLVFQNLQKVISYQLPAGSCAEIWPVLVNVFFGVPLPLSSFLMIIVCVFTDPLMSLSIIMEKAEFDMLSLEPRDIKRDHLITAKIYGQTYFFTGLMETCIAHAMFFLYLWKYAGMPIHQLFFLFEGYAAGFHGYTEDQLTDFNNTGQCVYFVTIVILQWGNALGVRTRRASFLQSNPATKDHFNPWLMASIIASLAIAIFVTEVPGLQSLFGTAHVPIEFWVIPIPLAVGVLVMDEVRKLLVRVFPNSFVAKVAW